MTGIKPQETESLYDELAELTAKKIQEGGEEVEVTHRVITKNNSIKRNALSIQSSDSVISPQIYIDDTIADIQNGKVTINEASNELAKAYLRHSEESITLPDINNQTAKENLYAVVINKDLNKEFLQDVPHTIVAKDLAIIPRFRVGTDASFVVKNHMLPQLGMTSSEVVDTAISNTREANQYQILSMNDVIRDMLGDDVPPDVVEAMASDESNNMLIISNNKKVDGSIELLINEDCKRELYDRFQEPAILLPSSKHEIIAVPQSSIDDVEELNNIINSVNDGTLEDDDILSDHPYLMSEDLKITIPDELVEHDVLDNVMTEETSLHISM